MNPKAILFTAGLTLFSLGGCRESTDDSRSIRNPNAADFPQYPRGQDGISAEDVKTGEYMVKINKRFNQKYQYDNYNKSYFSHSKENPPHPKDPYYKKLRPNSYGKRK